mgnify:CR=1 FL=1
MELVEGEDLSERIKRGPVPIEEAVGIALQIAEALEAAHEQGIVHRDLKPGNVMVTGDGHVKVLDFGLVGLGPEREEDDAKLTADGFFGGTPAFLAPEMVAGIAFCSRANRCTYNQNQQ